MSTPMRVPVDLMGDRIVGRRRELDTLRVWLDAARAGSGRLILCAGDRTTLIVILDDIHSCDQPSLVLLRSRSPALPANERCRVLIALGRTA